MESKLNEFENLLKEWNNVRKNLHVGVDPWDKVAGLCVDSWESWLSTTVSPADDSVKSESTHEWATGVSLAGVLATGIKTGTDHGVGDVILTISISAVIVTDNWDFDLKPRRIKTCAQFWEVQGFGIYAIKGAY